MSDQERLQAIKEKSRRQQAERAQAEIAEKRKPGRKKPERVSAGTIALALFAIVGLTYLYTAREPEQPSRGDNYAELAKRMVEYNRAAFRIAAVRELAGRGIDVDDPEAVQGERLSGDLFLASFKSHGRSYSLRGKFICESFELASEKRQNPACYRWQ